MSREYTEQTKLGPGFDAVGISAADDQDYPNDWDMEDTASSNVQVIGEVVPEMDVSTLGLTPTVPLSEEYLREMTVPSTAATQNPSDAGLALTGNVISGVNVAETTASGSQAPSDAQHPKESLATSRRGRSKSPHGRIGRELSPKSRTAELRARMARVQQKKMTQYLLPPPQSPPPPIITPLGDTVTRAEADVALGELQRQIGDATQRTDVLLQAVAETHQKAQEAGRIAVSGATGVAQTNAGLEKMVAELRQELHQMRMKIEGAEERANTAQRIADSAEQRANTAQYAADAAEQRAVAAQNDADAAKAKQQLLEQELRNADLAFQEERKIRTSEIAAAQHTIGALQHELRNTTTRLDAQGAIVQDVAGIGGELREARKDMALQAAEMREMGDMTDEMMGHVENLTTAFHRIDAEQQKGNVVNPNVVKSTPVHVQGTISDVKEPVGHVQTEPHSVINLMSGESEKQEQPVGGRNFSEIWVDVDEPNPQAMTSSQMTEQSGEKVVPTLFGIPGQIIPPYDQRNAVNDDADRPSQTQETEGPRVIVNSPPKLPSGTQKAIENIVQAHMERLGINARSQQASQGERESMAGNVPNPGPETSQFSFPRMQDNVAPTSGQQVFATAQWRPKEPPMFTGAATDDVYLWTSLVKQYFVFMCGNAQQEVAFAATLLRGAAHEWYMGYERRNGNRPPRDWPTMMQAILERFGSNIRAQEAHAKLLTVSQGKRSVRDYTSEFETLLGRLSTRDEDTWKRMYVWGLQPHLARAVALKYPTTIAQAAGHAEEIELAIRASQRPNLGQQGARATASYSARGGSQTAPRHFAQGRGRGNVSLGQQGVRGNGGRRGGRWNRGHRGGQSTTQQTRTGIQCFNCGQYGHYASQCPRGASTSGSSSTAQSVNQRSNFAQVRGNRGGNRGNRRGGSNRRTRFSGLNVVYDAEGNEYPVDEDGNLVLEFVEEEDAAALQQNQQNSEN